MNKTAPAIGITRRSCSGLKQRVDRFANADLFIDPFISCRSRKFCIQFENDLASITCMELKTDFYGILAVYILNVPPIRIVRWQARS